MNVDVEVDAGTAEMGQRKVGILGDRRLERCVGAVQCRQHPIDAVDIIRGGAVRGGRQRQAVAVANHRLSSRVWP